MAGTTASPTAARRNRTLDDALLEARAAYVAQRAKSKAQHEAAQRQRPLETVERKLQLSLRVVNCSKIAPGGALARDVSEFVLNAQSFFEVLDGVRLVAEFMIGETQVVQYDRLLNTIADFYGLYFHSCCTDVMLIAVHDYHISCNLTVGSN